MGNELVKTINTSKGPVEVYGCWDSDTPKNKYEFYDLYLNGECINEGDPWYSKPTKKEVNAFIEEVI